MERVVRLEWILIAFNCSKLQLLADPEVIWCDAEQLKHSLTQYPKLQSTLYPELNIEHPSPTVKDVLNVTKAFIFSLFK